MAKQYDRLEAKILILMVVLSCTVHQSHSMSNEYGAIVGKKNGANKGVVIEEVEIYCQENEQSQNKLIRKGFLARNDSACATVIISHGFMCDKYDAGFLRSIFPSNRFNVLSFDYRAHGENIDGQYCTFGRDEVYDLTAATKFIKNHPLIKKDKPIFIYGFSMGAVVGIEAQSKDPTLFNAMILDCPFDSSENIVRNGLSGAKFSLFGYEFDIPGKGYLQEYAFHPYIQSFVKCILKTVARMDSRDIKTNLCPVHPSQSIKHVSIPCLFIHCKNDEKISVSAVKSIYEGASGPKQLWISDGRRHYDSFFYDPEKYTMIVEAFMKKVLDGSIKNDQKEMIIEDDKHYTLVKRGRV